MPILYSHIAESLNANLKVNRGKTISSILSLIASLTVIANSIIFSGTHSVHLISIINSDCFHRIPFKKQKTGRARRNNSCISFLISLFRSIHYYTNTSTFWSLAFKYGIVNWHAVQGGNKNTLAGPRNVWNCKKRCLRLHGIGIQNR